MKEKIEKKLFKSNYLILTPKIHSFGGFFESFLFGLKIKNFYNKKLILAIPFIDVFRHIKINERKFDYDLIFKVFFKLSFKEKIYSIFFSIWLNLNLILIKSKFRTLIRIVFKINNIDDIIFYRIGFSDDVNNNYNSYNLDNYNLVYQANISEYLNNKSNSKIQNSQTNHKKICFCVKDENYQKIKAISLDAVANIENYRESLVYLLNNEYSVLRVGDSMMPKFPFTHKNYTDTTCVKNHYKKLKDTMLKSNIYFGTSGSHTYVAELYNLKKIISNSIDFQYLCASFNLNNWTIFKKIFDLKQKKFLSLHEIYELYNLIEIDRKRFIYVENDKDEIFDLLKNALNSLTLDEEHEKKLKDFHEIRNHYINKLNLLHKPSKLYEHAKTNIPFNYLKNYLYQNSNLNELSLKFYKNI